MTYFYLNVNILFIKFNHNEYYNKSCAYVSAFVNMYDFRTDENYTIENLGM